MSRQIFTNANLFDGAAPARAGSTVVIEKDRIVAVNPAGGFQPLPGDTVHDLAGQTLMPGMTTGHFHCIFHNLGVEPGAPGMENPPMWNAYRALANAQLALRCGFTSIASAGAPTGYDAQLERAIESGLFDGPRVLPCSRDTLSSADGFMPWWLRLPEDVVLIGVADGVEGLRRHVREASGRGARLFKMSVTGGHGIPGGDRRFFTREEIRVAVETARDLHMRVRAHVTGPRAIMDCIESGVEIIDHGDDLDDECIAAMKEKNCILLPSLYQPLKLCEMPPMFGFSPEQVTKDFRYVCEKLPAVVAAGVTICVGDDFGTAAAPHGHYAQEMAVYVEHAGIPALEVMRWATRNGAVLMGRSDDLGMLAEGRLADLVIVDGDPTCDITVLQRPGAIAAVMRDGRWMTPGRPGHSAAQPHLVAAE